MQATKFTVTITVEALSMDCLPALIYEVVENLQNENRTGSLLKDDGDYVTWGTKGERVDF
mgnify:CR=1 FL=1